jgi:hypothetical protein
MSVNAPWTANQVDNINRFQRFGLFHPFTCPGHDGGGDRTLVATRDALLCCHCSYKQSWVHEHMAEFTEDVAEKTVASHPFLTRR